MPDRSEPGVRIAPSNTCTTGPGDIFATTHWTVVLAAGRRHTPQADRALEELCRVYWFPLYAYVRRQGNSKEDAEDLTQAFFTRLLDKKKYLARLSPERGRFRAFLLSSIKHFLINEWKREHRVKRGGGQAVLSLDWQTADTQFQLAATNQPSPDKAFDREWAVVLLTNVIERLQAERESEGQGRQFQQLKVFLTSGKSPRPYAEVAEALGTEESAVRVAVHRLRKRYRQMLREEIANTLSDPGQVDEEMRALFGAFAG